ncbi:sulfotransferase [Ruegeria sp. R14_0]|uniref:sulfotransferase family protein n=1 Tax=Ruegeria sp. R14_0 TaxID=2821100 RepID=UPI001ADC5CF9|nr:sulfotransferase [Ruegeria sp. R14_0]MBO9445914.1 sulfotransferase [Ruegeria sp. R14_0]
MALSKTVQMAGDLRINQVARMAKRVLGARFLNQEDFLPAVSPEQGQHLASLARRARGDINPPILVLGVMPRSGTNFVRDLVSMHPDVAADPGRLYEFPLLHAAGDSAAFTRDFIRYFPKNREVLGKYDVLAMLAGAWFRELQAQAGDKRILLKCPHVQDLSLARHIFPDAKIILCLRDGRDVVDSSLKTFSRFSVSSKNFRQLADEWRLGTEAIMTFDQGGPNANDDTMIVRYEDIIADTHGHARKMLDHAGLAADQFPWDEIDQMPVRGSSRSKATNAERWQPEEKSADFNPVKRWAAWPDAKKAQFDKLAGSALELAGYER